MSRGLAKNQRGEFLPARLPVCTAACLALLFAAPEAAAGQTIPSEPVVRTADHFPETNERQHELFEPFIRQRGGAFLGVGSDQSYTLAAMAASELVFIVDYDPLVTRLHRAMLSIISACEQPACLLAALDPAHEDATAARLARELPATWEGRRTLRAFRVHRPLLTRRLNAVATAPDTWLSRHEWYRHVRELALRGAVIARTADLTGPNTVQAMGAEARRRGVRFEVVYLSNAEEYFDYSAQFLENLRSLAHTDALVLRTVRDHRFSRPSRDRGWHYNVQPLDDLLTRIASGYRDSSWILVDLMGAPGARRALSGAPPGISRLDASVAARSRRGPARWWNRGTRPATPPVRREEARLLSTLRQAVLPTLNDADAARVQALDLEGTTLAELGRTRLPLNPADGEPFALSGAAQFDPSPEVDNPEEALLGMLLDGVSRDLLAPLFEHEGRAREAAMLRTHPAAADLYAAYRLRERLLEICPTDRTRRGARRVARRSARTPTASRAMRACRAATRLVRPAPTRRTRPSWDERRTAILSAMRPLSELADNSTAVRSLVERLAEIARGVRATGGEGRGSSAEP